jgi:hypothetical protein
MPVAKISRHCGTCVHWKCGGKPLMEGECEIEERKEGPFLTFGCDGWEWDGDPGCPCCGKRTTCRGVSASDYTDWEYVV